MGEKLHTDPVHLGPFALHDVRFRLFCSAMASSAGYNSKDVVVCAAVRTPVGSFNGCLSSLKAHELGTLVIREVLRRGNVESRDVSEVIMGQVLSAGLSALARRFAVPLSPDINVRFSAVRLVYVRFTSESHRSKMPL